MELYVNRFWICSSIAFNYSRCNPTSVLKWSMQLRGLDILDNFLQPFILQGDCQLERPEKTQLFLRLRSNGHVNENL